MVRKFCRPSFIWGNCRGWASSHLVELGHIFFPASCAACGQDISFTSEAGKERPNAACSLCENCVAAFTDTSPRCDHCGLPKCSESSCNLCQKLIDKLGVKNILWQRMFVLGSYEGLFAEPGSSLEKGRRVRPLSRLFPTFLLSQRPSMQELKCRCCHSSTDALAETLGKGDELR